MRRVFPFTFTLVFALGVLVGAASVAQADVEVDYGASLRLRGFALHNGAFVNQLAANVRQQLQATGDESIDDQQTFIDMRLRAYLRLTPIDPVRMFAQVEVGDLTFGDLAVDGSASKNGGRLGTDGVIFESKHLYLEVDAPGAPVTFKGGLFAVETPLGLVLSDDGAGLQSTIRLESIHTTITGTMLKAIENSRRDLDGDGKIDNDYHDEDIWILQAESAIISGAVLGATLVADLDNSGSSPSDLDGDGDRDVRVHGEQMWAGLSFATRIGSVGISLEAIHNFGYRRETVAASGVKTRLRTSAWAGDARIQLDLGPLELTLLAAAATGRDPDRTTRDDSFHTIAPFYTPSNILYGGYGGFDVLGSDLSGTACFAVQGRTWLSEKLSLSGGVMFAKLTERPDVSGNVFVASNHRDLGWEVDLNVDYQLYKPLRLFAKSGVLFPLRGYEAKFDSPDDDPVFELILGVQMDL